MPSLKAPENTRIAVEGRDINGNVNVASSAGLQESIAKPSPTSTDDRRRCVAR